MGNDAKQPVSLKAPTEAATGTAATKGSRPSEAPLPFEADLWNSADKMRGQVEESECKHVVLGLIFLRRKLAR